MQHTFPREILTDGKRSSAKGIPVGAEIAIPSMTLYGLVCDKQNSQDSKATVLRIRPSKLLFEQHAGEARKTTVLFETEQTIEVSLTSERVRFRGLSEEAQKEIISISDEEFERIVALRNKRNSEVVSGTEN